MKTFTKRAATTLATLALAGSGALVATAPAYAASATFTGATISGLKSTYTPPTSKRTTFVKKSYAFTLNITGTASDATSYDDSNGDGLSVSYDDFDANFDGPSIKAVNTRVKSPYLPRLDAPASLKNGANTFTITLPDYATPGVYEIKIPVRQHEFESGLKTYKVATKRFTVKANTKNSLADTRISNYGWRVGKTATFYVTAPDYQKNATITLYYKKKGAKKYSKIVSKKLVVKKGSSVATTELKTKKLTKSGHIYFKVSGVSYASGYKTKAAKVTVTRR